MLEWKKKVCTLPFAYETTNNEEWRRRVGNLSGWKLKSFLDVSLLAFCL